MRALRPFSLAVLVFSLVAGMTVGLPPAVVVAAEPGAGGSPEPSVPTSALPRTDRPVSLPAAAQVPAAPVWPSAGSAKAQMSRGRLMTSTVSGESVVADTVAPGGLPVTVAAASTMTVEQYEQKVMRGQKVPETAPASVASVDVDVLDQKAAASLGVKGVAFTVAGSSKGRVELTVDYSKFANAYGGDFADRLRLVSLPECALSTPQLARCQVQSPVSGGRNSKASATVGAPVELAETSTGAHPMSASASLGVQVFAVTAGASSEQGNWGATNLSQAGSWQAGSSGGSFSYSIPVSVPPAPGGLAPKISFDYSSASVDGLTKSTTSQTSWLGEGWSYDPGFVERSYRPCDHDGSASTDLCWVGESPVTVVLNGVSSRLFRNDADGLWKAEDDTAGWKVERLTGVSNGARDGEAFKITTRDGTQYLFGSKTPANYGGVLNVWVYGNNPGEPCYSSAGFSNSGCMMPYRWNLDQVIDVHGNTMDYGYTNFTGTYGPNNGASGTVLYDISSTLYFIEYGANVNAGAPGAHHTARVEFIKSYRCMDTNAVCENQANRNLYLDTPWDQYCETWATTCPITTPTFWTIYRLASVSTYVWNGSSWGSAIDTTTLSHQFPGTPDEVPPAGSDTAPALWLAYVTQPGMPQMTFSGSFKRNRVDWGCCIGGQYVPPMNRIRLSNIATGTGETVDVDYTGQDCAYNSLPAANDNNNRRCFPQSDGGTNSWWHKYVVTDITEHDAFAGGVDERWHYDYDFTGSSTQALWKFDQNWHNPIADRTWSRWAGYSTVYMTHGNPDGTGPQQRTETLYYRGMNRDRTAAGGWDSRVVTLSDSWDSGLVDFGILAGTARRTFTIDGAWGNWKAAVRHFPSVIGTGAHQTIWSNPTIEQEWWRETETQSGVVLNGPTYRWTQTKATFDSTYGLPTKVEDLGDTSTAVDDRCTLTSYTTPNTTKWLVGLASQSLITNCATTPGTGDYLGGQQTFYDGSTTLGASPSTGTPTKTTALATVTAAPPAASDFKQQFRATGHDAYGRAQDVFDALDRKTTTAYTPTLGGPVTAAAVTGPMGTGWTVTTTLDPKRGQPTKVVDVNGKVTQAEYDSVGRLVKVWKDNRAPGSTTGITPDVEYGYALGSSNWVSTKILGPDGQQILAYQIVEVDRDKRVERVVTASGHRVFRVFLPPGRLDDHDAITGWLTRRGALFEWVAPGALAIDAADGGQAKAISEYIESKNLKTQP